MRGIQQKYGEDKVAVVLLDVDLGYGASESEAVADAKKSMNEQGVDWPCVIVPDGWDEMKRRFGIDGYSVVVIDPKGIVVTPDTYGNELEGHVKTGLAR